MVEHTIDRATFSRGLTLSWVIAEASSATIPITSNATILIPWKKTDIADCHALLEVLRIIISVRTFSLDISLPLVATRLVHS